MNLKCLLFGVALMAYVGHVKAIDNRLERVSAAISLKAPGNEAKRYPLTFQQSKDKGSDFYLEASEKIPLTILKKSANIKSTNKVINCK